MGWSHGHRYARARQVRIHADRTRNPTQADPNLYVRWNVYNNVDYAHFNFDGEMEWGGHASGSHRRRMAAGYNHFTNQHHRVAAIYDNVTTHSLWARVRTFTTAASAWTGWHTVNITVPRRPTAAGSAPQNVRTDSMTHNSFRVLWDAPADNRGRNRHAFYQVQVATNSAMTQNVTSVNTPDVRHGHALVRNVTITGRVPARRYYIRVCRHAEGWDSSGAGNWSGVINRTTNSTVPNNVGQPNVDNITASGARIQWSAPGNGGSAITRYEVQVSTTSDFRAGTFDQVNVGNVTSWTVPNRARSTRHWVRVIAFNANGHSASWSASREFTTLNTAPYQTSQDAVDSITANSGRVRWSAPTNGGSAITSYDVMHNGSNAHTGATTISNIPPGDRSRTITGLAHAARRYVWVRARNAIGAGPWSAVRSFTTLALAPLAPTVTIDQVTATSVRVNWNAPDNRGSALTGFTVTCAGQSFSPGGTARNQVVSGLTRATAVSASVVARNGIGSSAAGSASATTLPTAASVPRNVRFGDVGPVSARVYWTAPADDGGRAVTGYRVEVQPGGRVLSAAANATSLLIDGLVPGGEYAVRVRAITSHGDGAWSASIAAQALTVASVRCSGVWRDALVRVRAGGSWRIARVHKRRNGVWRI